MDTPKWFDEAFGHLDPEDIQLMTAWEVLALLCPDNEEYRKLAAIDFLIRTNGGIP